MNLVNIVTKRIFRGPETVTRTARAGGKSTIAAPEEEDSCLKLQGVRKCCGCFPKSDFEVQCDPPTTVSTFFGSFARLSIVFLFCRHRHKSKPSCTRRVPPPRSPPGSPYRPRAISRFNVAAPKSRRNPSWRKSPPRRNDRAGRVINLHVVLLL